VKYFVVSDIHGYFKVLYKELEKNGFFDSQDNILIVCGDAFDRGRDTLELLNFLLKLLSENRLIYIKGNHDDMFLQMIEEIKNGRAFDIASGASHHYLNGTWDTALDLSGMGAVEAVKKTSRFIDKLESSPLVTKLYPAAVNYFETDKFLFVHGFIPVFERGFGSYKRYKFNPNWKKASDYEWERARWINGMEAVCKHNISVKGKTIIVGHIHASWGHSKIDHSGSEWGENADFSPFYDAKKRLIAIDARTASTHRINCLVIEE